MEFDWGPAKATANLKKHRGSFHEAATVLQDPLSTSFPDEMHAEEEARFVTIGGSTRGRVVVVGTGNETTRSAHQRPSSDEARVSVL